MIIAVVDDRADVLEGRSAWLRAAGHTTSGYSFEEALANRSWDCFDTVVLDGRDDRELPLIVDGILPDRYLGPRVARHIHGASKTSKPVIILVSAYARTHPELSLRCQQSGVDFAFDYLDVPTSASFVHAIEDPGGIESQPIATWTSLGFASTPHVNVALDIAQASRATPSLISDREKLANASPYEHRKLREELDKHLPIPVFQIGDRRRIARKIELRPILRRLLGLAPRDYTD